MVYNINGIEIDQDDLNKYFDSLINKMFAVLGVYEDCEKINIFDSYDNYIDRVSVELAGGFYVLGVNNFISITNTLSGIKSNNNINHKVVKSMVFHCISIIKKMKVVD